MFGTSDGVTAFRPVRSDAVIASGDDPRRTDHLHDPASLYLRGVADALFSEIAWRADHAGSEPLEDLFSPVRAVDRWAADTFGNGLKVLQALRNNPDRSARHAVTTIRVGLIDAKSFEATAMVIVKRERQRGGNLRLAHWALAASKAATGWKVIRMQIDFVDDGDSDR